MTDPIPPFSAAEYDRRIAKTRAAMDAAGIDVMIVTDPSNQNWLTGYDGWSFYVHQAVVLPLAGQPYWWGRRQDANGALSTVDTERTGIDSYPDNFVQSTERHPMQHLASLLRGQGLDTARIGVEMENYYYSAKAHAVLTAELPDAPIVDATALVNWQRAVKSDEEIAFMRKAARISEKINHLAIELAEPGKPKNQIAAKLMEAAIAGVDDAWGDYPAIVPLMPSGPSAAAPHLTWDGQPMQTGEATFFELSGCYRRYHAPFCRSVFLGEPPDHIRRGEAALVEGLEAGLDAARAGNRACDIANALGSAMDRAGIQRGARCGYPIGLSYPPDWGERTISLRAEDETVLEPGMTFHFMPGLWMETWGLEITESILIRDDGPAECFCNVPRKLFGETLTMDRLADAIATLGDLIAFPTVSVDSNLDMIAYLTRHLEAAGARVEVLQDGDGTKANLWATLGPETEGGIVLSGHTDVVPVADQDWTSDPFTMEERDGKLFGRGACDMKGFIAACVAMAPLLASRAATRPVHFAFTHDEETGCIGASHLIEELKRRQARPAIAIIGEPTEMRVVEGHKGCYEYTTHFTGLEGHGSSPDAGVNAVDYAVRYVARLLDLQDRLKDRTPDFSRFDPPWTTINVGSLNGGTAHNIIAGKAAVSWEMRPVVQRDADFVKSDLAAYCNGTLLPAMQSVHPEASITLETIGEVQGLEPMDGNAARALVAKLTGANAAHLVPFGTEAGLFQSMGIDAVVCGPGSIDQAHKPDEYVAIDQMQACLEMLGRLGDRL